MVKTEYDYQTKRISHRILRRAIAGYVKNFDSARVFCLPGAEAREIIEVYDVLGIKRKNIVGVDRDKEAYEQLKQKNLGIELFPGEAEQYLAQSNKKFNIISLDYTELPNQENFRIIRDLFKNHRFIGRSILHTNFYAKRINVFSKVGLPYIAKYEVVKDALNRPTGTHQETIFWIGSKKEDNIELKEFRSNALTSFLVLCSKPSDSVVDMIFDLRKNETISDVFKRSKENEDIITDVNPIIPYTKEVCLCKKCHRRFRHFNLDDIVLERIWKDAFFSGEKEYSIEDLSRFQYVSDDNSLMFSDILYVNDNANLLEKVRLLVKGLTPDLGIIMKGEEREYLSNKKKFEAIARQYFELIEQKKKFIPSKTLPVRIDITPREELDQETAIKLLKSGWSYEMFEDKFKGVTPARIAAYKSHIKMGTYQKEESREEEKKVPKQEKLEERIFNKGIIVFDSNPHRLEKNLNNINFGNNEVRRTSVLHGFKGNLGILMMDKQYGLYVINTNDINAQEVVSELALRYCESNRHLNLLLIGNPDTFKEDINAARELGAKINVSYCESNNGYIQTINPLNLESLISDIPMQVVKKHEKSEIKKQTREASKKRVRVAEPANRQDITEPIYQDLLAGMPDEEIMAKYNLPKTKLAGKKMVLTKRGLK